MRFQSRTIAATALLVAAAGAQEVRPLAGMDSLMFPSEGHNHVWQDLEPFPDCGTDCPTIRVTIRVWAPGRIWIKGVALFSGHLLDGQGKVVKDWDAEWDENRGDPFPITPGHYTLEVWRWGQGFFDVYFYDGATSARPRARPQAPTRPRPRVDILGRTR